MNACISNADCGTATIQYGKSGENVNGTKKEFSHFKAFSALFFPAVSVSFLGQLSHLILKHLSLSQECHHQLGLVPESDVVGVVEPAGLLPDHTCPLLHHSSVILHC